MIYTDFKNVHRKDKVGLIICNGPSLEDVPFGFLNKYKSMGCNRITAMHPDFAPTYYVCNGSNHLDTPDKRALIDPLIEDDRVEAIFINRLHTQNFRNEKVHTIMSGSVYGGSNVQNKQWSDDPLNVIGLGYTITYPMLQIMDYMGFRTILIVGLDHNYPKGSKQHFYDNSEFDALGFEHAYGPYTPEAWKNGCDLVFSLAKELSKAKIINLTPGTACDIFEKESIDIWK